MGSYRTCSSMVKLQHWILSLRWKTGLCLNCSLGSCTRSEEPALGQNTHDDDDYKQLLRKSALYKHYFNIGRIGLSEAPYVDLQ